MFKPNERTFQGVLVSVANRLFSEHPQWGFSTVRMEENVGDASKARFADGLLYSALDKSKVVLIELKNSGWDANDDDLVKAAFEKAAANGFVYFITGTPRQLVVYKTFEANRPLHLRQRKTFHLSDADDRQIAEPGYEKQIYFKLKDFFKALSDLVHDRAQVLWDDVDKFLADKLSAYIQAAAADLYPGLYEKIHADGVFRKKLEEWLHRQDVFKISIAFREEDARNIALLANYLLFLKILFYEYLRRFSPLKLKELEIPKDAELLNVYLRKRFDDVLHHDYETIFNPTALDEVHFTDAYMPELGRQVQSIEKLDFRNLDCEIVGAIYNTLIDNQEQHDRGQHFTQTDEVDVVCAFCLRPGTRNVMDSGCGAGTFLVRSYAFFKHFHPDESHQQRLNRIWGVEIAPFPAFLATMNLCLLDVSTLENYPAVIQKDFSEIPTASSVTYINPTAALHHDVVSPDGKVVRVAVPKFDVCVGNPPYIRQELIENKERWAALAQQDFAVRKINKQSDLYVYYLMHTAAFLNEGGRLGYVVSSSWLDVGFGAGLQRFLLEHFKIIAVIEHAKKRSFETASVNTVMLILERCSDKAAREGHVAKFVKTQADWRELLGPLNGADRVDNALRLARALEAGDPPPGFSVTPVPHAELASLIEVGGREQAANWGALYFRTPEIYNQILNAAQERLFPLRNFANVRHGIKTGNNDFFFMEDRTAEVMAWSDWQYYGYLGVRRGGIKDYDWEKVGWYFSERFRHCVPIERKYMRPAFVTQKKDAKGLEVDVSQLNSYVLLCDEPLDALIENRRYLADYILEAERAELHTATTVSGRKIWYNLLPNAAVGDFIFPYLVYEVFRVMDNRKAHAYSSNNNFDVVVHDEIKNRDDYAAYSDALFLCLNSTLFRFGVELNASFMGEGLTNVRTWVFANGKMPDPRLLADKFSEKVAECMASLKARDPLPIFEEIHQPDRRALDAMIFEVLDLPSAWLDELYAAACALRSGRTTKAASVKTTKTKGALSADAVQKMLLEKFGAEIRRYADLLGASAVRAVFVPDASAKIPKALKSGSGLFGEMKISFGEDKEAVFDHVEQLRLFAFFYEELKFRNGTLELPRDAQACTQILAELRRDYDKNADLMKSLLASSRSKIGLAQCYLGLVMRS